MSIVVHLDYLLSTHSARNKDQKLVGCFFEDRIFYRLLIITVPLKVYRKYGRSKWILVGQMLKLVGKWPMADLFLALSTQHCTLQLVVMVCLCLQLYTINTWYIYMCLQLYTINTWYIYMCLQLYTINTWYIYMCLQLYTINTWYIYMCLQLYTINTWYIYI